MRAMRTRTILLASLMIMMSMTPLVSADYEKELNKEKSSMIRRFSICLQRQSIRLDQESTPGHRAAPVALYKQMLAQQEMQETPVQLQRAWVPTLQTVQVE